MQNDTDLNPTGTLHDQAPPLALPALRARRLDGRTADLLEREPHQLARRRRALHVLVRPQRLRRLVPLLRVYHAVGVVLGAEVALEAEDEEGEDIPGREGGFCLVGPLEVVRPAACTVEDND